MAEPGVDDIFKDFETKVKGDSPKPRSSKKELSPKEALKVHYEEEKQKLREKFQEESRALEEREDPKHSKETRPFSKVERLVYIGIILVLGAFVVIDLSTFHSKSELSDQIITASVVGNDAEEEGAAEEEMESEESSDEVEEEEDTEETEPEEEVQLSGEITLTLDKIHSQVTDDDNEHGEITQIDFTIDNGKDEVLTPVVDVFIFDDNMHERYETTSRGTYKGIAIKPGDKQSGIVEVSPKTFIDLELEKNIRLTLNDTKRGFLTAITDAHTIS